MSTKKSSPSKDQKMNLPKQLQHINIHAAGIDVGSRSHFVAVPAGASEKPVRELESFTNEHPAYEEGPGANAPSAC